MQLSRLQLDLRGAQVRRDVADPYEMHRTLVRAFVKGETQEPPRFLWRVESASAWAEPIVLVQSGIEPNWKVLEDLPSYLKKPVDVKKVDVVALLQEQARYRFRLHANPTVTREGKRYGLVAEDKQLDWLARQGKRLGFRVETALVTGNDVLRSRAGGKDIWLQYTCFEGVLQPADTVALGSALYNGIGPGKAFGCGLLSLARLA